jgi:hypothetical protein
LFSGLLEEPKRRAALADMADGGRPAFIDRRIELFEKFKLE